MVIVAIVVVVVMAIVVFILLFLLLHRFFSESCDGVFRGVRIDRRQLIAIR